MYSIIVLSVILLMSIVGISSLLVYKFIKITGNVHIHNVDYNSIHRKYTDIIKDSILYIFERVLKKITKTAFIKSRYIYNKAIKHIYNKYLIFVDSMNGKGNVGKKGAASFFLKSVSEYKKEVMKNKRK